MEKYIGVKLISAEPQIEGGFSTAGQHGGIIARDGYKVVYEDGYKSWSPKDVFEKAYRKIDALTFGLAVEGVKLGKKIAREGWNGKGMFVYYVPANKYPFSTEVGKSLANEDGKVSYNAYLAIKNVNGTVSTWVPSINDVLAEDWLIVE